MVSLAELPDKELLKALKNDLYLEELEVISLLNHSKIKLAEAAANWFTLRDKEIERCEGLLSYECEMRNRGYVTIAGLDEAGRGPLAGPVVAAAVILPKDSYIFGINDSKKLSEKKRFDLEPLIKERALAWGIGIVSAEEIDRVNILQATFAAMKIALGELPVKPDALLLDAVRLPGVYLPQEPIVHGDAVSLSIGAASILAKCQRDRMMLEYHEIYPEYNFAKHKGYGTKEHLQVLANLGPSPIHRKSFIVKNMPAAQNSPADFHDEVPW